MATTWGGLGTADYGSHIFVANPSSWSGRPICSIDREPLTFEGSIDKEPLTFEGVEDMSKIIEARCLALQRGTSRGQYISFQPVTLSDLAEIDNEPRRIGKHVRIRYHADQDLLIVKLMSSAFHEVRTRLFAISYVTSVEQWD